MGSLFGSDALEVAISFSLFFLLVSFICTAIREAIESLVKSRALDLERALRELLDDPDGTGTVRHLLDHPLIAGLFTGRYDPANLRKSFGFGTAGLFHVAWARRRQLPSYIPAGQFASAIVDLAARGPPASTPYAIAETGGPIDLARLRSSAAVIPNPTLRRAIETATDDAGTMDEVRGRLEAWFNGSMDRASGWYKRRTQWVLLGIGVVAAIQLNLDSVTVARRLFEDPKLRATAIASAEAMARRSDTTGTPPLATLRADLQDIGFPVGWSWIGGPWPAAQAEICTRVNDGYRCADGFQPTGAVAAGPRAGTVSVVRAGNLLLMPFGWLITALAVTLGAPFWFDLLKKFMIVRATVKPVRKSADEASPEPMRASAKGSVGNVTVLSGGTATAVSSVAIADSPLPSPYIVNRWAIGTDPDEGLL